jgi:hypothetical protein
MINIQIGIQPKVARWFISKPKIPVWVNLGGPLIGKI